MDTSGDIFGTTSSGGSYSAGTVFEIANGTTGIITLGTFNSTNGAYPADTVTLDSAGKLYGTSLRGGANGYGTVFEISKGTSAITVVASFNGSNGVYPQAAVTIDPAGDLFGTTPISYGTIFEIIRGTTAISTISAFNGVNGGSTLGNLTLDSSGDLFGTTNQGGNYSLGVIFASTWRRSNIESLSDLTISITVTYPARPHAGFQWHFYT